MSNKILWVSRHDPTNKQLAELEKMYGKCVIVKINSFKDAAEIVNIVKNGNYTDVVAIIPLGALRKLVENGIHPLFPVCEEVKNEKYDFVYRGKKYIHKFFKRVKNVNLEFY